MGAEPAQGHAALLARAALATCGARTKKPDEVSTHAFRTRPPARARSWSANTNTRMSNTCRPHALFARRRNGRGLGDVVRFMLEFTLVPYDDAFVTSRAEFEALKASGALLYC